VPSPALMVEGSSPCDGRREVRYLYFTEFSFPGGGGGSGTTVGLVFSTPMLLSCDMIP